MRLHHLFFALIAVFILTPAALAQEDDGSGQLLQWLETLKREAGANDAGPLRSLTEGVLDNGSSSADDVFDGGDYSNKGTGDWNVSTEISGDMDLTPTTYEAAFPIVRVMSESDAKNRQEAAVALSEIGVRVDWRRHSLVDLLSFQVKASKARELQRLGVRVDWRKSTYSNLDALLTSARLLKELESAGAGRIPQSATLSDLEGMVKRVRVAKQLEALGKKVDWRSHDLDTLEQMLKKRR